MVLKEILQLNLLLLHIFAEYFLCSTQFSNLYTVPLSKPYRTNLQALQLDPEFLDVYFWQRQCCLHLLFVHGGNQGAVHFAITDDLERNFRMSVP